MGKKRMVTSHRVTFSDLSEKGGWINYDISNAIIVVIDKYEEEFNQD